MFDIYSYIHCEPLVRKCRELRRSFDEYEMAKIVFDSFCPIEMKHAWYHGLQRLVSERPERRFRRLERELEKCRKHIDPLADYPEVADTVIFSGDGIPYTTNRLREDPHPTATDVEMCSGAATCRSIVPFQFIYVDYPVV